MKKLHLLILLFVLVVPQFSVAQPPPPPPPGPTTAAPIDSDFLYFIIPAVLFAVYRLNKNRVSLVTDLK